VSITGARCELGCEHCAGTLLHHMLPVGSPDELVALAGRLQARGALGMLVSGGSDREGRLPWSDYLEALARIKATTSLKLSVHAGLVDPPTASGFARAGVDAVLFDVVGSDRSLRTVFHLAHGLAAIEEGLDALVGSGVRLFPHIVVGLDPDGLAGERNAVDLVARRRIDAIAFVVFMPIRGTPMERAPVPDLRRLAEVLAYARERMPEGLHALGCARPRDAHGRRLEALALLAGVNRLAVPTGGAERAAAELGLEVNRQETCCAIDLLGG
jgi:uncharacterized radical SAM superfamily protein